MTWEELLDRLSGPQWQQFEYMSKFQQIHVCFKMYRYHQFKLLLPLSFRNNYLCKERHKCLYFQCLLYSKICASEINMLQVCLVSKQTPQGMEVRDQLSWEILTIKFKVCDFLQSKKDIFKSRYQNLQVLNCESLKSVWLLPLVSPFGKILALHSN